MFTIHFCKNTKVRFAQDFRRVAQETRIERDKKARDEFERQVANALARKQKAETISVILP